MLPANRTYRPLVSLSLAVDYRLGGGLQPVSQAILRDTFPPEQLGTAFAVYGMVIVLAPGERPRVTTRAELAREFRAGGLDREAEDVERCEVATNTVAVWLTSDAISGLLHVAVERLPGDAPTFAVIPPIDALKELLAT